MSQENVRGSVSSDVSALKAGGHIAATNPQLRTALEQTGLKVFGPSVARFLAHAPSRYPKEKGEAVFIEVFDSGEDAATEERYICWVFSYRGAPLLVGKPASEIEKAVNNLRWQDLSVRLYAGIH